MIDRRLSTPQGAVFSRDRAYRYLLWRRLIPDNGMPTAEGIEAREAGAADGPHPHRCPCLFIMLNPSTADATRNDPTIRRCIGFATGWGHDRLLIANLFGYRATFPAELKRVAVAGGCPIGPGNNRWIRRAARYVADRGGPVVLGWGIHGAFAGRDRQVLAMLKRLGIRPLCLGVSRHGLPRHVLYLRKDQAPIPFDGPG